MFEYHRYRIGKFLALHLPLNISYALATFLSEMHYLSSKKDRVIVRENLKAILADASPREINRITHEVFRNFGRYLNEFFRFTELDKEFIDRHVKIEGMDYVDEALRKGKGIISLSAHLGNWELGGITFAMLGYPFVAVTLLHSDQRINNFFNLHRECKGVTVVHVKTGMRECFRSLRQNKIIALMGDRDFTNTGILVDFLGRPALIPRGAAVFHLRTGARIVPVFMIREGSSDYFRLVFEKPIEFTPTGNEEADIMALTNICIKVIESYIRRYPEQWLMFRPFWFDRNSPREEVKII